MGARAKRVRDILFGRPLHTEEQDEQRIGPLAGVPVLGLDALASASYGPEAALTVLLVVGAAAPRQATVVLVLLVGLLLLVQASYRQTLSVFADGGGSY